jgi:hypothetical protein
MFVMHRIEKLGLTSRKILDDKRVHLFDVLKGRPE